MSADIIDFTRVYESVDVLGNHTLGQRGRDHRGDEFIFAKASSAISARQVVIVDENHNAYPVTAANSDRGDRGAVAEHDVASGSYSWFSIYGKGNIHVLASAAASASLYTSATAGSLDDASASQNRIQNIYLTTARGGSAGVAPGVWYYPYMSS